MRRSALILAVLVAGCALTADKADRPGPANPITGDAIMVTTLDAASGDPAIAPDPAKPVVKADAAKPASVVPKLAPVQTRLASPEEVACLKTGGIWSGAGVSGAKACVKLTRDGGKSCRRERDCEGYCLAQSMTCAPATPMFGCNEILQDNGVRVTLCID